MSLCKTEPISDLPNADDDVKPPCGFLPVTMKNDVENDSEQEQRIDSVNGSTVKEEEEEGRISDDDDVNNEGEEEAIASYIFVILLL